MKQATLPFRNYISPGHSALILALLASVLLSGVGLAHALLLKSEPEDEAVLEQAPEQVVAWFSQELDTSFSIFQVFDSQNRQVDNGDGGVDLFDPDHASMIVTLPESLPNGTYLARWTVVSAEDGDLTEGEFSFIVGEASPATDQAAAGQQPAPANDGDSLPLGWIAAGLIILVLVVIGLGLGFWQARRS